MWLVPFGRNRALIQNKRLPPGFPNITNPPSSKAVEVGHNAVLHCTVTGDPTPKVWWIRELLPLDIANNDRYSILESGSPGIVRVIVKDVVFERRRSCTLRTGQSGSNDASYLVGNIVFGSCESYVCIIEDVGDTVVVLVNVLRKRTEPSSSVVFIVY
ncbi:hypothetical protein PGB90_006133 [Kerria lacca]